jgi:hypothetical protein
MKLDPILFYVGIIPEDSPTFFNFIHSLNEDDVDQKFNSHILKEFDDLNGYYNYLIKGTWEAYKCFIGQAFVKSLEHFEE